MRELGNDVASVLAKVGARPEQVNDDAIRLEVPKQIRILELASEELQDRLLGFHLARNFDLREIGLVYYVIASSERLADALLNGKRYCTIMNEGVRLNVKLDDRAAAIALDYVDVLRQRINFNSQTRSGFVDQIDRFVRQEPIGNVAVRKCGGRHDR